MRLSSRENRQQKRKLNSKPVNTAVGGRFIFLILALHETKNVKIDYNLVTSRHSHAKLNSLKCVLWRRKKKSKRNDLCDTWAKMLSTGQRFSAVRLMGHVLSVIQTSSPSTTSLLTNFLSASVSSLISRV